MAGKFGKFGLKALFLSCTFTVRVTEALDHESTNEDFRDVAVTINQCSLMKSTSKAHVFKTVNLSIDFFQRS